MHHHPRPIARFCLALLLGCSMPSAWADESDMIEDGDDLIDASSTAMPEPVDIEAQGTPRQIIDTLLSERRDAPAVPPQVQPAVETIPNRVGLPSMSVDLDPAVVGALPGAPLPKLRREGEFIVERPGRLISINEGEFWVFEFDHLSGHEDLRPMIMQKCQRLASMQDTTTQRTPDGRATGQTDTPFNFSITGQVHTYRGANFLLPTAISGTSNVSAGDVKLPAPRDDADNPARQTTVQDLGFAADPDGPRRPSKFDPNADPADLMDDMLSDSRPSSRRPSTSPIQTATSQSLDEALRGVNPDDKEPAILRREGEYLVNRAGRLVRGAATLGDAGQGGVDLGSAAGGIMFAFEADGRNESEAPMVLMPCKLLELMEDTVVERGDQVVFLISGRVHTYRGANYLLPTTMRIRLQPDNLTDTVR